MEEFYKDLMRTAQGAGLKVISDDRCCQILAWLLHFGGGCEKAVFDVRVNTAISVAQDRLGLHGGRLFTDEQAKLIPTLRAYSKECEAYINGKIPQPEWLGNLAEYYKIPVNP